ncbi:MAG: NAD(P)/FAD-dependent oxidoreductase, partial [Alloprevotella sp.]
MQHFLIIGGGLGGLFTAAFLAKEGHRVTVLEKNAIAGGGLQSFPRYGRLFDTGMHVVGGFHEGGSLHRICRYLGILDALRLHPVDTDCMDEITYLSDGTTYRIAGGREGFVESWARHFPQERGALQAYVDALYALTEELDAFYLRPAGEELFQHSEPFLWAADRFIAHYITDPRLRDALAYMNPMYGGVAGETPAFVHALISVFYLEGTTRFAGGSVHMAEALTRCIESHGGRVLTRTEVVRIAVEEREVRWVETRDGTRHTADCYISAVHAHELLRLVGEGAFPKAYRRRLLDLPMSPSLFCVY